jgi:hypothetical protein
MCDAISNTVKEWVVSAKFIRFDPENKERRLIDLPVNYWNIAKAPGMKFQGWLNIQLWTVKVWVDSLKFPTQMNINLTGMELGDSVLYKDIVMHPELKAWTKQRKRCMCSVKRQPRGDD